MNTLPPDTILPPELQQVIDQLAIGLPVKGGTVTLIHEMHTEGDVLCRAVLKTIPDTSRVGWVLNPRMSLLEFMRVLCQAFRVTWPPNEEMSVDALEARLKESLRQSQQAGKQCVLVLNQAQNAPFFALNRLSQFNAPDARGLRLLQIVMIGQRGLLKMLEQAELKPTADAIVARHELPEQNLMPLPVLDERVTPTARASEWPAHAESRASRFNSDEPAKAQPAPGRDTGRPVAIGAVAVAAAALVAWALWPSGGDQKDQPAGAPGNMGVVADSGSDKASASPPAPAPVAQAPAPAPAPAPPPEPAPTPAPAVPEPAKAAAAPEKAPTAVVAATAPAQPLVVPQADATPPVAAPKPAATADGPQLAQPAGAAPKLSELSDDQDATWPLMGQLWGVKLPAENACEVATGQRVQCFRYSGLSIEQVRLIDRPSMLLMAQNGVEKWVRLLAMDNSKALLASSGRQWSVSLDDLKAMWTGVYATLWRLPLNHNKRVFAATMDDEAGRWLNQQLKALQARGKLGPTEDSLAARVKAFQRANKLRDDGRATPSTFVLVSRMVGVDEPNLRKPIR